MTFDHVRNKEVGGETVFVVKHAQHLFSFKLQGRTPGN
jgi:hypothetical protein